MTKNDLYAEIDHGSFFFPLKVFTHNLREFPNNVMSGHFHEEMELYYIRHGTARFIVADKTYTLHEGNCFFINANCLHQIEPYNNLECEYSVIIFLPSLLYGFRNSLIEQKYLLPFVQNKNIRAIQFFDDQDTDKKVCELINSIMELFDTRKLFYELKIQIILQQIWMIILEKNANVLSEYVPVTTEEELRTKKIVQFLSDNYQKKLTLKQISQSASISKSECCRVMKKILGRTPLELLCEIRMSEGIELLKTTNKSITDIANEIGYDSSGYFSSSFRQRFGCSPREFRNNYQHTLHRDECSYG